MTQTPQKMRLAVQSGLLRYYPLELAVRSIRDAGYDGIELWGGQLHGHILDLLNEDETRIDQKVLDRIRDLCAANDLAIACYTPEQIIYPLNYLVSDALPLNGERMRERSRRMICWAIDIAAGLGCRSMVLISPMCQWRRNGGEYRRLTKEEAIDAVIREVHNFVRYAEQRDVVVVFEAVAWQDTNGIVTLEDTARLFDAIPSPNLELLLDTGHIEVNAHREGLEGPDYFRRHLDRFHDRIGHVHVDDNFGKVDSHLVPGKGKVDLNAMLADLQRSGYNRWLSVELNILGEYVLPDTAERLLAESYAYLANTVGSFPSGQPGSQTTA